MFAIYSKINELLNYPQSGLKVNVASQTQPRRQWEKKGFVQGGAPWNKQGLRQLSSLLIPQACPDYNL